MRLGLNRRYYRHSHKYNTRFFIITFISTIILFILICTYVFFARMHPVFCSRASSYANNIATNTINKSIGELMAEKGMTYSSFVNVQTDTSNNITGIEANTITINTLKADLASKIQYNIDNIQEKTITIPLGSLIGNDMFNGAGYKMPIKIAPISITKIDFNDSFTSVGINQVKHSIYLDINVTISVVSSTMQLSQTVTTSVPIAETVIVGRVPNYYSTNGTMAIAAQ